MQEAAPEITPHETPQVASPEEPRLRYDYQPWEYFLAPKTQEEITHKYSILRRTVLSDKIEKPDPESMSIKDSASYL